MQRAVQTQNADSACRTIWLILFNSHVSFRKHILVSQVKINESFGAIQIDVASVYSASIL